MIVKVQTPLASTEEDPGVLVYNEDRSLCQVLPLSADVEKAMGGLVRRYFRAEVVDGVLVIGREVPPQGW